MSLRPARYHTTADTWRSRLDIYIISLSFSFSLFSFFLPITAGRARSITQLPHYLRIAALRRTIIAVRSSFALNASRRLRNADDFGQRRLRYGCSLSRRVSFSLLRRERRRRGRTGRRGISLHTYPRWGTVTIASRHWRNENHTREKHALTHPERHGDAGAPVAQFSRERHVFSPRTPLRAHTRGHARARPPARTTKTTTVIATTKIGIARSVRSSRARDRLRAAASLDAANVLSCHYLVTANRPRYSSRVARRRLIPPPTFLRCPAPRHAHPRAIITYHHHYHHHYLSDRYTRPAHPASRHGDA